jgi:Na+(H+)/acetate symporter ActP
MASKMDRLRLEHRTALVKKETAELQLRARWVGVLTAAIGLATAVLSIVGGLLLILRI